MFFPSLLKFLCRPCLVLGIACAAKLKHCLDERGCFIFLPYFPCWVLKWGLLLNVVKQRLPPRQADAQRTGAPGPVEQVSELPCATLSNQEEAPAICSVY